MGTSQIWRTAAGASGSFRQIQTARRSQIGRPQPKNPKEMVWRSHLHGKNKVPAIKTHTVPVWYPAGPRYRDRKAPNSTWGVHSYCSTLRLDTEGPQGRPTNREHQGCCPGWNRDQYARQKHGRGDALLSKYLGQHKPGVEEQLEASRQDKPRHCTRHRQFEEVSNISQKRLKGKMAQRSHRGSTNHLCLHEITMATKNMLFLGSSLLNHHSISGLWIKYIVKDNWAL